MRIEAPGRAGDARGKHRGQDQITRDVDADRDCERLVLLERDHRTTDARIDQATDHHIGDDGDTENQIVVRLLAVELERTYPGQPKRHRRDRGQREWPLCQLDPVQRDQSDDLGKADSHDDEVGASHFERQFADGIAAERRDQRADHET